MKIMNIWLMLFITAFSIMQVKNEHVLLGSNDCQTKCPIRRQTIRSYPPGTALFVGDECVCGGPQETIYEYVPPSVDNVDIPVGLKPKTIEHRSNNRVMGNYGSLVFSGDVQILNSLSIKNDDIYKGCCVRKPSNPSSDNLIMSKSVEVNLSTTISGFSKKNTTRSDVENCTDKNVSIITEPVLQNSFTRFNEFTSGSIVTDELDLSDKSKNPTTLTSLVSETQTSTDKPEEKEVFEITTTEDSTTLKKNNDIYLKYSKKGPNLLDKYVLGTTNNNSYLNKKLDLQIHLVNSNTINFNNLQDFV